MARRISADDIYNSLKDKLKSGELVPDNRIIEQDIAEIYNVSRTPVRQAIQRLVNEGLLISIPNLGTFVKRFTVSEVREIFEIREVLEGLAFRKAAENFTDREIVELKKLAERTDIARLAGDWDETFRTDEEFHNFIVEHCGNAALRSELAKFSFQTSLLLADLSSVRKRIKRKNITVTHKELAQSAKNPLKAEELMREHIAGFARWLFTA